MRVQPSEAHTLDDYGEDLLGLQGLGGVNQPLMSSFSPQTSMMVVAFSCSHLFIFVPHKCF